MLRCASGLGPRRVMLYVCMRRASPCSEEDEEEQDVPALSVETEPLATLRRHGSGRCCVTVRYFVSCCYLRQFGQRKNPSLKACL